MLSKGESTYRFDCNTVGPVPVASGYGSSTLTQSAAHALFSSEENVSSLQGEARSSKVCETPVMESRDSGIPITSFTGSTTSVLPQTNNNSVKTTCFTGSTSGPELRSSEGRDLTEVNQKALVLRPKQRKSLDMVVFPLTMTSQKTPDLPENCEIMKPTPKPRRSLLETNERLLQKPPDLP